MDDTADAFVTQSVVAAPAYNRGVQCKPASSIYCFADRNGLNISLGDSYVGIFEEIFRLFEGY